MFRAGCVQLRASADVAANLDQAEALIRSAAGDGCHYVQTPEMTAIMELSRKSLMGKITLEAEDEGLACLKALAKDLSIWLHIGSMAFLDDKLVDPQSIEGSRAVNRSLLINPCGEISARYDKIHMFDVELEGGERYIESSGYRAGREAVVADLPWGQLGLSICYDLRFPSLYRMLCQHGAGVLAVPAAFTEKTGKAHWHVLLRARAIENGAFVLAAAQGGVHENGRHTYGHSLIIDPWGRILAEAEDEPCYIAADIDMDMVANVRRSIPSLGNDQPFEI